jgi:hypothetical protein
MNLSNSFSQRRFNAKDGGFRLPSPEQIRDTSKKQAFESFADEILSVDIEDHIVHLDDMRLVLERPGSEMLAIRNKSGEMSTHEIDLGSRFMGQLSATTGLGSEEMMKWLNNEDPSWRRMVQAAVNNAIMVPLKAGKESDDKQMVRLMDGKASAILSNGYGRIDAGPTVDWLSRLVRQTDLMPIHWDYNRGDLVVKLVSPLEVDVSLTNRMDNLFFGMELRNSMTGGASFDLSAFIYRLICTNGMRHTYEAARTRRIHRGQRISQVGRAELTMGEERLVNEVLASATKTADTLTSSEYIEAQVLEIHNAQKNAVTPPGRFSQAIAENPTAIRGLSKILEIPQESTKDILARLWAEPSAGLSDGPEITAWGLAHAITSHANGLRPEKAQDMMGLGGAVKGWTHDKLRATVDNLFADARR